MSHPADSVETPLRRWRVVAFAFAVGLVAVLLGVPQFMAGLRHDPYNEVLFDLARGRPVSPTLLKRTAESREAAFAWLPSGQFLSELATLRLSALGSVPVFSPERRGLAADALSLQTNALALAPGDGFGWTRLLQAMAVTAAPVADIERVLGFAIDRAPRHTDLVLTRIRIATIYWQGLSEKTRALMTPQFVQAATLAPTTLARIAKARLLEDAVAARLAGDPVALARFNFARARLATAPR